MKLRTTVLGACAGLALLAPAAGAQEYTLRIQTH